MQDFRAPGRTRFEVKNVTPVGAMMTLIAIVLRFAIGLSLSLLRYVICLLASGFLGLVGHKDWRKCIYPVRLEVRDGGYYIGLGALGLAFVADRLGWVPNSRYGQIASDLGFTVADAANGALLLCGAMLFLTILIGYIPLRLSLDGDNWQGQPAGLFYALYYMFALFGLAVSTAVSWSI